MCVSALPRFLKRHTSVHCLVLKGIMPSLRSSILAKPRVMVCKNPAHFDALNFATGSLCGCKLFQNLKA